MSSILATTLILSIHALAIAPLLVAVALPRTRIAIGAGYTAAILGMGLYHTGIFHQGTLSDVNDATPTLAAPNEARCRQIFELIQGTGLVVKPDALGTMAITGVSSDQIPPAVRDVIVECAERQSARSGGSSDTSAGPQ